MAKAICEKMQEKGITREQVTGVGVGVPGPVIKEREVTVAVNLHWGYTMLADELEKLLNGISMLKVGNDANVAAFWEKCGKAAERDLPEFLSWLLSVPV